MRKRKQIVRQTNTLFGKLWTNFSQKLSVSVLAEVRFNVEYQLDTMFLDIFRAIKDNSRSI